MMGDPRVEARSRRFNETTGVVGYMTQRGRTGGNHHPDRCVCQGSDTTPHKHYPGPPFACARCECSAYVPAVEAARAAAPPGEPHPDERDIRRACEAIYADHNGYWPSDSEKRRIASAIAPFVAERGDSQVPQLASALRQARTLLIERFGVLPDSITIRDIDAALAAYDAESAREAK